MLLVASTDDEYIIVESEREALVELHLPAACCSGSCYDHGRIHPARKEEYGLNRVGSGLSVWCVHSCSRDSSDLCPRFLCRLNARQPGNSFIFVNLSTKVLISS